MYAPNSLEETHFNPQLIELRLLLLRSLNGKLKISKIIEAINNIALGTLGIVFQRLERQAVQLVLIKSMNNENANRISLSTYMYLLSYDTIWYVCIVRIREKRVVYRLVDWPNSRLAGWLSPHKKAINYGNSFGLRHLRDEGANKPAQWASFLCLGTFFFHSLSSTPRTAPGHTV